MKFTQLASVDWQPVVLLKAVRLPFSIGVGISVKRAYLALDGERLLMADWTLEAAERTADLVTVTGWNLPAPLTLPQRLDAEQGFRVLPRGTWLLPYAEPLYQLYLSLDIYLRDLIDRIDQQPNSPRTFDLLRRFPPLS